jgi:hypothetical protein
VAFQTVEEKSAEQQFRVPHLGLSLSLRPALLAISLTPLKEHQLLTTKQFDDWLYNIKGDENIVLCQGAVGLLSATLRRRDN